MDLNTVLILNEVNAIISFTFSLLSVSILNISVILDVWFNWSLIRNQISDYLETMGGKN